MQVSIETVSGLERRMTVGVPAEQVDSEVTERLQKAAATIRLDGFRKGKVPMNVVRQRFGKGVRQEVVGEVVSRSFADAVQSEKVRPAGQPSIESLKDNPGEDLEYIAVFEVYPEIEIQDFSKVSVTRPVAEVKEADVDKMIEILRKQHAEWTPVDRAAKEGDQVKLDYVGRKDGEEFEGGKADGASLELGSGQMIPGFEDAVVGMKAGDSKTVQLKFPDDYHNEELKGADVEFDLAVHEVSEKVEPELNEEFFAKFGVKEGDLDTFKEEVKSNMERELRNAIKTKIKNRVMAQLQALHEVDLPSALVKAEIQALRRQMLSQFGGQNIDESLLPDDLFAEEAQKRVVLGLILAGVIEKEGIKADGEKVKAQIEEIASTYEDPQEVVSYYYSNEQLLNSVHSAVLEEQVVEKILAAAQVADEECSYEEAVQPDQRAKDEASQASAGNSEEEAE